MKPRLSRLRAAFLALVTLCLFAAGCRTNLLPEYVGRFKSARAAVYVPEEGHVRVSTTKDNDEAGKKKNALEQMANVAVGLATGIAAASAQAKLHAAMPATKVQLLVAEGVAEQSGQLGFPLVGPEKMPDTQLDVRVRSYGVESSGENDPAMCRFQMYGSLTYLPEDKLIWEYAVYFETPLSSVNVAADHNAHVSNVSNIVALAQLDEHDVQELFTAATRMATAHFMTKFIQEYSEAKAHPKAQ